MDLITSWVQLVAIWGAVLSTILLVVRFYENRKDLYLKLKLTRILPESFLVGFGSCSYLIHGDSGLN